MHKALVKRIHNLLDVQLLNDLLTQLAKPPLHTVLHHPQRHIVVVGGGEAGHDEASCGRLLKLVALLMLQELLVRQTRLQKGLLVRDATHYQKLVRTFFLRQVEEIRVCFLNSVTRLQRFHSETILVVLLSTA